MGVASERRRPSGSGRGRPPRNRGAGEGRAGGGATKDRDVKDDVRRQRGRVSRQQVRWARGRWGAGAAWEVRADGGQAGGAAAGPGRRTTPPGPCTPSQGTVTSQGRQAGQGLPPALSRCPEQPGRPWPPVHDTGRARACQGLGRMAGTAVRAVGAARGGGGGRGGTRAGRGLHRPLAAGSCGGARHMRGPLPQKVQHHL